MRQWTLDPMLMCIQHISGEHLETHMFLSAMKEDRSLDGFYDHGLFFGPKFLKERHELLADELPGHKTPLEFEIDFSYVDITLDASNKIKSTLTLLSRCENCRKKYDLWLGEGAANCLIEDLAMASLS
jgi:hypothetical protein